MRVYYLLLSDLLTQLCDTCRLDLVTADLQRCLFSIFFVRSSTNLPSHSLFFSSLKLFYHINKVAKMVRLYCLRTLL